MQTFYTDNLPNKKDEQMFTDETICPNCQKDTLQPVVLGARNLGCPWCWVIFTPEGNVVWLASHARKDYRMTTPTMTRKDFELIAEVLAEFDSNFLTVDGREVHNATIAAFADRLADTNPLFNRDRFILAATNGKG